MARHRIAIGALCVLALAACSDDGGGTSATSTSPNVVTTTTATNEAVAVHTGDQWPSYGHDLHNTRTNIADTEIGPDTVADLALDWEIPDLVGVTGTPVVDDGAAYFTDWMGQVWAVEADTGDEVWRQKIGGMIVGSPAVTDDAVYASSGHSLFRLDRSTGKQIWRAETDTNLAAQINASPIVVDDLVLQGTAGFENMMVRDDYTFRGSIAAFDAASGELVWQFFTTNDDAEGGAGGGVWSTPAVDTDRGLLFVGSGQSLEEPTSKHADSMLAIDYRTGELQWSTQFTYPDVFSAAHPTGKDADVGASPNLWTAAGRDLVGAGDKGGTYHALDRDTGEVVWETQLTPGSVFGGEIGSAAFVDGILVASSNVGDPETNAPTDTTKVFGLDPVSGKKRWETDTLPGKIFAPVSAVPGVAFVGTDRGRLHAFASDDGEELWAIDAPTKTASGASIVGDRVLWGYGFTLFGPAGPGGVMSFSIGA